MRELKKELKRAQKEEKIAEETRRERKWHGKREEADTRGRPGRKFRKVRAKESLYGSSVKFGVRGIISYDYRFGNAKQDGWSQYIMQKTKETTLRGEQWCAIGSETLEVVIKYIYLVQLVPEDPNHETEVTRRIRMWCSALGSDYQIMNEWHFTGMPQEKSIQQLYRTDSRCRNLDAYETGATYIEDDPECYGEIIHMCNVNE